MTVRRTRDVVAVAVDAHMFDLWNKALSDVRTRTVSQHRCQEIESAIIPADRRSDILAVVPRWALQVIHDAVHSVPHTGGGHRRAMDGIIERLHAVLGYMSEMCGICKRIALQPDWADARKTAC